MSQHTKYGATGLQVDDYVLDNASAEALGDSCATRITSESALLSNNSGKHGTISQESVSPMRAKILIFSLTLLTIVGSMSTGVLNISIPRIQEDLALPNEFELWPASIYSLVCGCFILPAGSIADIVGSRSFNFAGTIILGFSLIAAGLANTGPQIIVFRGLQGLGVSICLPTAISILSHSFPSGRIRTIGFAFLSLGQPLGFSLGLVLGGVFETLYSGWRSGFYLSGIIILLVTVINFWVLPKDPIKLRNISFRRLRDDLDWIGMILSSACLGILSFVLAMVTESTSRLQQPINLSLLIAGILLIPVFIFWMDHQEKKGKRALIPNYLWKNIEFSCICVMVVLAWGVIESMDLFFSLFYQNVQQLSALDASIRFIPSTIAAGVFNIFVGYLVHRFHIGWLVFIFSMVSTLSPAGMSFIDPSWSYWVDAFWASSVGTLACDVIFTVANLITTSVFSEDTQGLAGAVFNALAQFGASLGIAAMAMVNSMAKKQAEKQLKDPQAILMFGYRRVFWTCTASMIVVCTIGAFGLRKLGKASS